MQVRLPRPETHQSGLSGVNNHCSVLHTRGRGAGGALGGDRMQGLGVSFSCRWWREDIYISDFRLDMSGLLSQNIDT